MRPSRRMPVNKRRSARRFRSQMSYTKMVNIRPGLTRGGIRL